MSPFLQNKYTNTYHKIIDKAKTLNRKKGKGLAHHHIIPAHFYIDNKRKEKEEALRTKGWLTGNPDESSNLVYLTHREHLICHLLLRKMVEKEKNAGVIYAAWRMVNYEIEDGVIIKVNSRLYDKIRTEVAETHSETMKGRSPHNKGKKVTDPDHLARIKKAANDRNKEKLTCPHCDKSMNKGSYKQYHGDKCPANPHRDSNIRYGSTGSKRTEEWKKQHSELMCDHYVVNPRGEMAEEHKEAISRGSRGVCKSQGTKERMKESTQKRLDDGTHSTQILVSCIETRKVYRYHTFIRYVINKKPGSRAKKK